MYLGYREWDSDLKKDVFVVCLEGTTDDYRLGRGDGENDPFIWIPEEVIDAVPWAFGMDKEVKRLIKYI